jgi:hypothetical protein
MFLVLKKLNRWCTFKIRARNAYEEISNTIWEEIWQQVLNFYNFYLHPPPRVISTAVLPATGTRFSHSSQTGNRGLLKKKVASPVRNT